MTNSEMDKPRRVVPPRLARAVLELMLPAKVLEFVLGDLEEQFQNIVASNSGLRGARRWYWRQVADAIFHKRANVEQQTEPQQNGDGWIGTLWDDTKYGMRVLSKKPGFLLAALSTLALGIGGATAIFSAVNSVILKPVAFRDPDRVVTVWERNLKDGIDRDDVSPANFLDWQDRQQVFESIATINPWGVDYTGPGEPETWISALVSKGFFHILGVNALYGRTFLPEEHQQGGDNVVILSYRFWQRRFGGDRSIVGQAFSLDGRPTTIVGVMPQEFRLYLDTPEKEVFQPQVVQDNWKYQRRATYLNVVARLKPEVSLRQAQSAMETIAAQLASEHPQTNRGVSVNVIPFREHLIGKVRLALLILLAAVGFVVLIGCANLANLQLARGNARRREIAIRLAMGANRFRIVQQLMMENLIVALLGCAAGLLVAKWAIRIIVAVGPESIPRLDTMKLDPAVAIFAIALSFLNAMLFGLLPSLHLSRLNLQHCLKEGGAAVLAAGPASKRLRNMMVISQVAIAIVLLVGVGLFSRSLIKLLQVNPGFVRQGVVALQVFLYGPYEKPEQRLQFTRDAISRLRDVPGVNAVGITTALPFFDSSSASSYPITIEGQPVVAGQEQTAFLNIATRDYFSVMGIPLQSGNLFEERDQNQDGPIPTIINDAMARRLNLGQTAIGKKIQAQLRKPTTLEIIGVVGSLRHDGLDQQQRPEFYISNDRSPSGGVIFTVRTSIDPSVLIPSLKSAIWEIDPALPFYRVTTLEQLIDESLMERRFHLILLGSFAGIAMLLCAIGLYGLISFLTAQRTNEIGIRIVLGAQKPDIWKMITGQGMRLALTGITAGVAGAFWLTQYLKSLLFEIQPIDPFTYVVAIAILLVLRYLHV